MITFEITPEIFIAMIWFVQYYQMFIVLLVNKICKALSDTKVMVTSLYDLNNRSIPRTVGGLYSLVTCFVMTYMKKSLSVYTANIDVLKTTSCQAVPVSNIKGVYSVSYTLKGKNYKFLIRNKTGVSDVLTVTNKNGDDITSEVMAYMGPNYDWHSASVPIEVFNTDKLTFEMIDGTKNVYTSTLSADTVKL